MKHWYVYHSQDAMGHAYASLGGSAVFVTSKTSKMCLGDLIWVIEGDRGKPRNYQIADCFKFEDTDYPPFTGPYSRFQRKLKGNSSLLPHPVELSVEMSWFNELHSRFITKQRFCESLTGHSHIENGLMELSGVGM